VYDLTTEDPTIILADLYNYGALIAFMLTNLSLIKLRNKRPELYRPFRSPLTIRVKRKKGTVELPLLAVLGFVINLIVWILVLSLHEVGRIFGTVWFIIGILAYYAYRKQHGLKLNEPIEGTLLTSPENAAKLHPDVFEITSSTSILEEEKELEQIEGIAEIGEHAEEIVKESAEGSAEEERPEDSAKESAERRLEDAEGPSHKDEP
jgi:hypothetical protein